ncbi:TPA: hypothetical protein MO340_004267 [Salmonella enterica subsp. salamae serovar 35:g,m,s,t:-]|nr:hypothetical protein [Salmonella enterica subsp. salamae serovar 35:g,m,s,t:-]HCA3549737.1 hypothetical protein [Salmonella enterica subsp. salamae serovar 35:g,m,s,t:-]
MSILNEQYLAEFVYNVKEYNLYDAYKLAEQSAEKNNNPSIDFTDFFTSLYIAVPTASQAPTPEEASKIIEKALLRHNNDNYSDADVAQDIDQILVKIKVNAEKAKALQEDSQLKAEFMQTISEGNTRNRLEAGDNILTLLAMKDNGYPIIQALDNYTNHSIKNTLTESALTGGKWLSYEEEPSTKDYDERKFNSALKHVSLRSLTKAVNSEPDDNKAISIIIDKLSVSNAQKEMFSTKIEAEEVLLNIRSYAASDKADDLAESPAKLSQFLNDTTQQVSDLSKVRMSAPEDYKNSLLRQNVEQSMAILRDLQRHGDVDSNIQQQCASLRETGSLVLDVAHTEAFALTFEKIKAEEESEKAERYLKLKNTVLSADNQHDAMNAIDSYNENYFGGHLDNNQIYRDIWSTDNPEVQDTKNEANRELAGAKHHARWLLEFRTELISCLSELEGNITSYNVSKDIGFDTSAIEKLQSELKASLPIFDGLMQHIADPTHKFNVSEKDINDITRLHQQLKEIVKIDHLTPNNGIIQKVTDLPVQASNDVKSKHSMNRMA